LVTRIKEGVPYTVGFVLATLTLSPTYLQFHIGHVVEDYELKEWVTVRVKQEAVMVRHPALNKMTNRPSALVREREARRLEPVVRRATVRWFSETAMPSHPNGSQ